ncbi:MAG: hypothetical protein MJE63_19610 [Proteobacteria bacterium]|nr:hypothetical protein [Pseudomonadota bacterium]
MIDKDKIIETVLERLKKLPVGHYLDVRTYKRNRYVMIVRQDQENLLVIQNGYESNRFQIKNKELKKLMKTLLKKEFPRSNKVRLYTMGNFVEAEAIGTKRKVL